MSDLADLEHQLTEALVDRAAAASPPADAWPRIVARLRDESGSDTMIELTPDESQPESKSIRYIRRSPLAVIGAAAAVILAVVLFSSIEQDASDDTIVRDDPETPQPDVPETPEPEAPDPVDKLAPPTSITWSQIEEFAPFQVLSDGQTFFARAGAGGSRLYTSTDGTTWTDVAAMPSDRLDAAWNGKVLSVQTTEHWSEGRSDGSITVHVIEADGTITETSVVPVIPDRHAFFAGGPTASATFLGPEGLVISGSYEIYLEPVVAAAVGAPLEDITGFNAFREWDRFLADAGVSVGVEEFADEITRTVDGAVALLSDVDILSEFGLTRGDIGDDFEMTLVSPDGADWEQVDLPADDHIDTHVTIEGAILRKLYAPEARIYVSEDGLEWTEVLDVATRRPLPPYGELLPGPGHALYIHSNGAWVITAEGASQLVTDDSEFAKIDAESVEDTDGGSMTIGDAGVAYLTGFTSPGPYGEPVGPTAIVVSTDYETWTRFSLPDEMTGLVDEEIHYRMSVGASGVVVWGMGTAWYGEYTTS